jgi:hypothetical protein
LDITNLHCFTTAKYHYGLAITNAAFPSFVFVSRFACCGISFCATRTVVMLAEPSRYAMAYAATLMYKVKNQRKGTLAFEEYAGQDRRPPRDAVSLFRFVFCSDVF